MGFWDVFNSEGQGDDQSSKPIDYEKSVGISQTHSANNEVYSGNRISQTGGSSTVQQGAFSGLGQVASNVGLTIGHTFNREGQGDGIHYAESVGFSKTHSANNEVYDGRRFPSMEGSSTAQQGAYAASDIGQTLDSEGQGGYLPPQPNYYQESTQQDVARQQMSGVANFIAQVPRVANFITQVPEAANLINQVPGAANFLPFMQELSNVQGGSSAVPTFNSEGQGGSRYQVIVTDDDPSQPTNVVIVEDDEGAATTSFNSGDASGGADILGGFSNGQDAGSRLPQQQHIFLSDDPSKPTIVVVEDFEDTNAGVPASGTGATTGAAVPSKEMTPNLYSGDVSQDVVVEYGEPIMDYYEPTWEQGGGVPLGVPMSGWREPAYTGADFYPGDVQVSIGANETYVPQGREPNIGGYMPVTYNNPVY
mmetsp:Transcript_17334/g.34498  ORF Transcript_17334/g.34498 Transcript_17334/m.34498 type:complete len:422 (-) Transcript_17334:323-1588(-)